jgi:RsiW-degrading membrane proteinase PrsW (M82 family)
MNEKRHSLVQLLVIPLLLLSVMLIFDLILGLGEVSTAFKRFANALLTSYTLGSGAMLGAMFFYADSRNKPLSPLIGMLFATFLGAVLMLFALSYSDLLLEGNGSMQAQFFSNVVHLLVVTSAICAAFGLNAGLLMSFISGQPPRTMPWDDEEE